MALIWNPRASHTHQIVVYKSLKSSSSESLFTSLQNTKFKECDQIQTKNLWYQTSYHSRVQEYETQ